MKKEKKFRLASRSLFLTYPQTSIPLHEVKSQLSLSLSYWDIKEFAITQEKHLDGNKHIHAWIKLHKKLDTKNPRLLDLSWENKNIHGKYEGSKKDLSTLEYVLKGVMSKDSQDYLVSDFIKRKLNDKGVLMKLEEAMIALAKQGNISEALDMYEREKPEKFILNHDKLRKSLTLLALLKNDFIKPKFSFQDFQLSDRLQNIVNNFDRTKTLVLVGEPGAGKSLFLETFVKEVLKLRPLKINNIDALRFFDSSKHDAIILDDISDFDKLSREGMVSLIDSVANTTHNIKHGTVVLPAETLRCMALNKLPPFFDFRDQAIHRRVNIYQLKENLFRIKGK